MEAESTDEHQEPQFAAEIFAINVLNIQLRDVDIPCRINNEFLILMPCTDVPGADIVCDRLETLFRIEAEVYEKVDFKLHVYIGAVTLPSDKLLSSKRLLDGASQALDHAIEKRSTKTVKFSDIKKD